MNKEGLNVFSCFDGISCAQYTLKKLGIPVNKYYASEIDQRAMKVTKHHFPKTLQYGDIKKIKAEHLMSKIDLLCGGSPCQGFSFAGKQLNFKDPRSKLFFEFVRLKNELNPKYFFLENVRMKKESQDVISDLLDVEPIYVDSALVCAGTRKRLYWTNIPGFVMPEDRGILLNDILIDGYTSKQKSFCLDANYAKGTSLEYYQKKSRRQLVQCVKVGMDLSTKFEQGQRVYSPLGICPTLDTKNGGNRDTKIAIITHSTQPRNGKGQGGKGHLSKTDDKSYCIDTTCTTVVEYNGKWRKLLPVEAERIMGLPDGYTDVVSTSARYHGLGNGWQIDTIEEFFKHLK